MKTVVVSVALAALAAGLGGSAAAQDVLSAKDDSIRLRLENDRVRVLERTLRPGEREQPHSHPAHLIHVVKGGKLRDHNANGKVVEIEARDGAVLYVDPKTHWAENVGTTTINVIVIELKDPATGGTIRP